MRGTSMQMSESLSRGEYRIKFQGIGTGSGHRKGWVVNAWSRGLEGKVRGRHRRVRVLVEDDRGEEGSSGFRGGLWAEESRFEI